MAGNHKSTQEFDMHQSEETWKNFRHLSIATVIACIVIVVGLALFVA